MCTAVRFSNEEGFVFLGRNLDWSCGYGENVRIMPKGFMIPWAFDESTPAKHAVIGMCVEFQNYPLFFDCGSDAGLAVAGLNHPGCAEYAPNPIEGKTNIAAYEFPTWVAANFETVDEVDILGNRVCRTSVYIQVRICLLTWRKNEYAAFFGI